MVLIFWARFSFEAIERKGNEGKKANHKRLTMCNRENGFEKIISSNWQLATFEKNNMCVFLCDTLSA